jgi:hypothetical protein
VLISCQQEELQSPESNTLSDNEIAKIKALGFSSKGVVKVNDGYIVEGDIFIPKEDLNVKLDGNILRVGETEQYHTTRLVTNLPRVIKVAVSKDLPASYSTVLQAMVDRYNAENLQIQFQVVSRKQDILFTVAPVGSGFLASAGFPTAQGYPWPLIQVNSELIDSRNTSFNTKVSIFAHEVGHCIGFRHTDYMNRSFSCGGPSVNEGEAGVGAIHIPGTPTDPDAGSWMLSCIGRNTDRPFNLNDKIALSYLYK